MELNTSNTGPGAPTKATSSAFVNSPSTTARALTLAELIDAFMAAYADADKNVGGRLEFWCRMLGARPVAQITPDDVADALAELARTSARTFLRRAPRPPADAGAHLPRAQSDDGRAALQGAQALGARRDNAEPLSHELG